MAPAARMAFVARREIATTRSIARTIGMLVIVAGAACHDAELTSPPRPITPGNPALLLTGASGTNIFALAQPGDPQDVGKALGLNDVGQVTGAWYPAAMLGSDARVFRWSVSTGAVLVSGCCGGDQIGFDINDAGVITGQSFHNVGIARRAFRATGNTIVNLPTLATTSPIDVEAIGLAINNRNNIVGWSTQGTGYPRRAVLWSAADIIHDLGTLGGDNSQAIDINDSDQVIGWSETAGNAATHWFLWSAGGMQDLNVTVDAGITSLVEINGAGQIVGTYVAPNGQSHAFRYTPGSGLLDLGTLGGTSSTPTGLNDKGDVVGASTLADGSTHAFLWTQKDGLEDITAVSGVPEVRRLHDGLQTLTGTLAFGPRPGAPMPRLVQLTVTSSVNQAPVASFTFSCTNLTCSFDATGSTDDKGIVSYAWDLNKYPGPSATGATVTTTYPHSGTRNVTLTVTDAEGLSSSITKSFDPGSTPPPADAPPVARFTSSCTGTVCTLDASTSTDDVGITSYDWSLGKSPGGTATGVTVTTDYWHTSTRTVTLTVTDTKGQTSVVTQTVVVP